MSQASNADLDAQVVALDRRRRFILFRDLAAHSTKEWLVHKLLGVSEASAFYGKPGDGKSVLVEDMGLHVAAGMPWHGRPVLRGAVVFVALERRMLVERRAIAFREKHGVTDLPFAIVGGVHDFRDPKTAIHIVEVAREVEDATAEAVTLVVIDTLSRALCGGDENSPKDMGAIVNSTGVLLDKTKAHVSWVHHIPIDGGERMRGHGALLGGMDTTVLVAKHGEVRAATVVKANDSEEGERLAFTLESIEIGREGDNVTTAPVVIAEDIGVHAARKPGQGARLTKAAQTALRALREALSECGAVPPASNHIPENVRVVTIEQWRTYAYRMGISAADTTPRAQQAAFKRASEHLIGSQAVAVWDEAAWLT